MPPVQAFTVHDYYQPVERALRSHHVLKQHVKVFSALLVIVLFRVGIFKVRHYDAFFFACNDFH